MVKPCLRSTATYTWYAGLFCMLTFVLLPMWYLVIGTGKPNGEDGRLYENSVHGIKTYVTYSQSVAPQWFFLAAVILITLSVILQYVERRL